MPGSLKSSTVSRQKYLAYGTDYGGEYQHVLLLHSISHPNCLPTNKGFCFPLHILGKKNAVFAFRFCRPPDDKRWFRFCDDVQSVCIALSVLQEQSVVVLPFIFGEPNISSKRMNMPWWGGFEPHAWDVASLMVFTVPVVACLLV